MAHGAVRTDSRARTASASCRQLLRSRLLHGGATRNPGGCGYGLVGRLPEGSLTSKGPAENRAIVWLIPLTPDTIPARPAGSDKVAVLQAQRGAAWTSLVRDALS